MGTEESKKKHPLLIKLEGLVKKYKLSKAAQQELNQYANECMEAGIAIGIGHIQSLPQNKDK